MFDSAAEYVGCNLEARMNKGAAPLSVGSEGTWKKWSSSDAVVPTYRLPLPLISALVSMIQASSIGPGLTYPSTRRS